MNLRLEKKGYLKNVCMQLTVEVDDGTSFVEDVADLNGITPQSLIDQLREVANELEANNDFLTDKNQQ